MADINLTGIQSELEKKKNDYIDLTHQLNNYNEIYNLNVYLQKLHSVELDQITSTDQQMKTASLKTKQQYLLLDYAIKDMQIRINIMYFTLIMVCFILILSGLFILNRIGRKTLTVVIGVLLLIWALIVYVVSKVNSNRRKYAFDQYYWKNIKKSG